MTAYKSSVRVIGVPEHLNQYVEEVKEDHALIDALKPLKRNN